MIGQIFSRKKLHRRTAIFITLKLLFFTIIISRLYKLQVIDSKKYKTLADENRIKLMIRMPERGKIYDDNGSIIASNKIHYSLKMTPGQIDDLNSVIVKLNSYIDLETEEVELIKNVYRTYRADTSLIIKRNLDWNEVAKISTNLLNLSGVEIDTESIRHYPKSSKYFHIAGYTSSASKEELRRDNFYSYPGIKLGKSGVELTFEMFLRGFPGTEEVEVNSRGKIIRQLSIINSIKGSDVYLTLNTKLQEYTISRLGSNISAAAVLDVNNGNILSSVSIPSFNPNVFSKSLSKEEWEQISTAQYSPLLDKTVQGLYPPGSIFKIVIAIAALKYGVVNRSEKIFCNGKYKLGKDDFHCWKKNGHGNVSLVNAISESCDNYFYEISLRLGIEKIYKEAKNLGVGRVYEHFLQQEEGIVPNKSWKEKNFGEPWQKGETLNTGIGQGYVLLTPVEIGIMTSIIVNGGKIIRPNIIKGIKNGEEDIKIDNTFKTNNYNLFDNKHLNIVKKGMFNAVNTRRGTAWKSRVADTEYIIGGKTGTSQVRKISFEEREKGIIKNEDLPWSKRDHALFIGFATNDKPKFVTVVVVEHGGSGAKVAAPIGRDLLIASREILLGEKTKLIDNAKEES